MADQHKAIDKFDRALGALAGLPDVASVKPTTVQTYSPLVGAAQTFIIQTMRQRERGDTIFVTYVDDTGSVRLAIPPEAADAIARQRDALGTKNRKRAAREEAQRRKAAGIAPAFMKKRKAKKAAPAGK